METCENINQAPDDCGAPVNNPIKKLRLFASGSCFDEEGNYLGQGKRDGDKVIVSSDPLIPPIDLTYLRSTLYRGYANKDDSRWIFAFDNYNANNPRPLGMDCAPCYVKVIKFLQHDRRHK